MYCLANTAVLKWMKSSIQTLDKQYILSRKKEAFGYQLLTNQKQFYLENYPKVVVENGTIDEAILMMIKGKAYERDVDKRFLYSEAAEECSAGTSGDVCGIHSFMKVLLILSICFRCMAFFLYWEHLHMMNLTEDIHFCLHFLYRGGDM